MGFRFGRAVISCAGTGSRLGRGMPKCMIELGGRPLLHYQLELLKDVEDVRIVVGFRKDLVMDFASRARPGISFVHNDDYRTTTNAYSLHLATRDIAGPFLIMDGDTVTGRKCFRDFMDAAAPGRNLLGVTPVKTECAIYAHLNEKDEVIGFSQENKAAYEWTGIACLKDIAIDPAGKYVFQEFLPRLPLPAFMLDTCEIDTHADYAVAKKAFPKMGY